MIDAMIAYALTFIGIPYIYGGSSPMDGFDCSGYVLEVLSSVGLAPRQDKTAQQLYDYLLTKNWHSDLRKGSIIFFGKNDNHISHVAIALDMFRMVEASGGDSTTTTIGRAIEQKAFIKIRPIDSRRDLVAAIHPEKLPLNPICKEFLDIL